ncbi:MaoC family dehydratase [Phenylobacterium montanum]|uniref:MaoC family dehydratase N-terminal domain-containing protein n=1 Tax=Phenylobacterium montanum TaxID=2823693 RepID=A0A975FVP3_9CAUL|nr:MaoC family dehydratase [Caulobacter sp. S6]QUD86001.1 MaoC family dehydratase N-terminal domain-containing protein [Caulobacter sp. S6]
MAISYPQILDLKNEGQTFSWKAKDTILYALGVGMGWDPLNDDERAFVYEKDLKPVPSQAGVVAWGANAGNTGINYLMVVDGERKIVFHKPLPTSGEVVASSRIVGAWDKGPGKGAVVMSETELRDKPTGELMLTITGSTFARGDGGFGGPSEGQPEPHKVPDRAPDMSVDIPTRDDQAVIYRLSGDYNPLHIDPAVAKMAGFEKPILHGMCTYGITCRAVLQTYAEFDPARFKSHQARFSAPVYPGETITVDLWKDGDVVSFEARIKARGVTVIKNGKTVLG